MFPHAEHFPLRTAQLYRLPLIPLPVRFELR